MTSPYAIVRFKHGKPYSTLDTAESSSDALAQARHISEIYGWDVRAVATPAEPAELPKER